MDICSSKRALKSYLVAFKALTTFVAHSQSADLSNVYFQTFSLEMGSHISFEKFV